MQKNINLLYILNTLTYSGVFTRGGPGVLDPLQTLSSDPYFSMEDTIILFCVLVFFIQNMDHY